MKSKAVLTLLVVAITTRVQTGSRIAPREVARVPRLTARVACRSIRSVRALVTLSVGVVRRIATGTFRAALLRVWIASAWALTRVLCVGEVIAGSSRAGVLRTWGAVLSLSTGRLWLLVTLLSVW